MSIGIKDIQIESYNNLHYFCFMLKSKTGEVYD